MTTPASTAASSLIDPQALMAIRNLEFRARTVVEGFRSGLHRSPYHGFSVEFTEYRQYTPGDDPRHLDWKVLGRSDRSFIKKFEDETNLRCHLLVDQSRSMAFSSIRHSKAEYAATLAATLAWFLHLQGDAVGLLSFDEGIRDYLPAKHRAGHLRQLMLALEKPAGGQRTDLAAPLQRAVEIIRKRGLLVLLSDFLAPIDRLESGFRTLAACGHEMVIFQVLDPAEPGFGFREASMFRDLESGRELFIDPGAARKEYTERLDSHCAALLEMSRRLGVAYHRLTTDRPFELALLDLLGARQILARRVRGVHSPTRRGAS